MSVSSKIQQIILSQVSKELNKHQPVISNRLNQKLEDALKTNNPKDILNFIRKDLKPDYVTNDVDVYAYREEGKLLALLEFLKILAE